LANTSEYISQYKVTKLNSSIYKTYKISITDKERLFGGLVMTLGLIFALGIFLVIQKHFSFEFHDKGALIWNSWQEGSREYNYPKQQDIFNYVFALIFVPLFSLFCWGFWIAYNTIIAEITRISVKNLLRLDALTFLPFLLVLSKIHLPERTFSQVLLLPLILFLGMKLFLFLGTILYETIWYKEEISTDEKATKSYTLTTRLSSLLKLPHLLLKRIKIPLFLSPSLRESHWYPIAAGLCIGLFILVEYGTPSISLRRGYGILLISSVVIWLFWLVYSKLMSVILRQPMENILRSDAPTYLSAMLLLAQAFLFSQPHSSQILIPLTIILFITGKILVLYKNEQTDKINHISKRILLFILIPALIWAFSYNSNIHGGIDFFHEGERLGPTSDFLHGKIPFRDIYVQHGLFQNISKTWLAFKLFGESIGADRSLSNNPFGKSGILTPLGFIAAYFLGLMTYRKKITAIIVIVIMFIVELWLTERHALAFLSLALIVSFLDNKKVWKLWLAGIFTTLAIFNSLETGLYTLFTSSLFFAIFVLGQWNKGLKKNISSILGYIGGVFVGFIPFFIYLGWHGALDDFFWVSYTQCKYQIPIWGIPFPTILPELTKLISFDALKAFLKTLTFKWYLPTLIYIAGIVKLTYLAINKKFESKDWKLVLLLVISIVFFRTALGRSDFVHLLYALPPFWLITIGLLERQIISTAKHLRREEEIKKAPVNLCLKIFFTAIFIYAFIWYLYSAYNLSQEAENKLHVITSHGVVPDNSVTIEGGGKMLIPESQANSIKRIVEYIKTHTEPDEYIFDLLNQGMYYFLADRPNPTRFYQIAYAATEEMEREVVADLKEKKPKYILAHLDEQAPSGFAGGNTDEQVIISEYINANYQKETEIEGITFLRRR